MESKVCTKCGESKTLIEFGKQKRKRDGRSSQCKDCLNLKSQKWRKNNPHYYRQEHLKAYYKSYHIENRESILKKKRLRSTINKEHERKRLKRYRVKHPERVKFQRIRRSLSAKLSPYQYTEWMWEQTLFKFGHQCAYCGEKDQLEKEHVVPASKGGMFVQSNIIPACSWCNKSKKDREYKRWYRQQPFYSEKQENFIKQHVEIESKIRV